MEDLFSDELVCLQSSYDASEFASFICNQAYILKFTLKGGENLTFEIPQSYPHKEPLISLASSKLVKAEQSLIENELRDYASALVGSPMIMDLVTKLQESLETHFKKANISSDLHTLADEELYKMMVILIDHMRQKNRYLKTLCSWTIELNIYGVIMLCHKWIFLIIQGTKKQMKEFITRLKTSCIDVDSSGKPCKEKMSKILCEEISKKCFSSFSIEELGTVKDLQTYLQQMNLEHMYENVIKPIILNS